MKKICTGCARELPIVRFALEKQKNGKTYRRHRCFDCRDRRKKDAAARPTAPSAPSFGTAPSPRPPPKVTDPIAKSEDLEAVLIVPDTHVPYHDERAWQLMLAVGRELKPKHVIVLGDFVDFYAVSFHTKDPKRVANLSWEIQQAVLKRQELDELGASNKVYIKGNHEDRLDRYIATHAGAISDMVDFDREMGLTSNGWQVVPYRQGYDLGHVSFTHDTDSAGVNAHRQSMNVYHGSVVIGHTHRMGYDVVGSSKGKRILAAMLGWLGDFGAIDYVHKQKALRDWVHGFGVGYYSPESKLVFVQPVPIVEGSCVVHGVQYSANW